MSLEQVKLFYDVLTLDQKLYEEYFDQCSAQGFFGNRHWNKTKIVNFAASIGYSFTENQLEQTWFDSSTSSTLESSRTLAVDYKRKITKYPAKLGFS